MGCKFQDQGGITIDEGALIGHNVVLATINNNLDPAKRQSMNYAPIHIGKNVWIGANATVLAGYQGRPTAHTPEGSRDRRAGVRLP